MANDKSMSWKASIIKVLDRSSEPMNCSDIALEVEKKGFRKAFGLNATPANSISTTINVSIANEGEDSPFVRSARGLYTLKRYLAYNQDHDEVDPAISPTSGIINALGMFWERSKVIWKAEPRLLGKQQLGAKQVDFCKQIGVYLLHDT